MAPRVRDPEQTRSRLVEAAFDEVHRQGFHGASLERILDSSGVTKGAMYHHFANKAALGHAVLDEVVRSWIYERWLDPLQQSEDPLGALENLILHIGDNVTEEEIRRGCPLNNLAQELTGLDAEFQRRIQGLYDEWMTGLAEALRRGQERGGVRSDVDPQEVATFIMASLEGGAGLAKSYQSADVMRPIARGLLGYVRSLRPGPMPGAQRPEPAPRPANAAS